MDATKLSIDIVVYNILIRAMCRIGKLADAKELFSTLSSKGLQPDAWTYNAMIDGLLGGGLGGEAINLLREMDEHGFPPDNYT